MGRKDGKEVETGNEKLERQEVVGPAGCTFKLRRSLFNYLLVDHNSCAALSLTLVFTTPPTINITPTPQPS